MKKIMYKRVLGVFILAFSLMGIINTYAEEGNTPSITAAQGKCEELENVPREEWTVRYAIEEQIGTKGYTISINEKNLPSDLNKEKIKSKMKFKLTEIKYYDDVEVNDLSDEKVEYKYHYTDGSITSNLDSYIDGDNKILTIDKNVVIKRDGLNIPEGGGVEFTFTPIEQFDPILKDCEKMRLKAVYVTAEAVSDEKEPEEFSYGTKSGDDAKYVWTDCSGDWKARYEKDKDGFDYKYCESYWKAKDAISNGKSKEYVFKDNKKWPDLIDNTKAGTLNFKCNYKDTIKDPSSTDDYYVNKDYLYGYSYITQSTTYNYNTEKSVAQGKPKSVNASCKVKCEEVVIVEYGPPVASKAGLCFEYKVKVTSRVNCKMEEEPTPPTKAIVCTPTPQCKHSWGIVDRGGPNEEFDSCIDSCDGGVYSDRCTNKCYKEVYGSSVNLRQSSSVLLTYETKPVGYVKKGNNQYVYETSNNKIYWRNGTKNRTDSKDYTYPYSNHTGRDDNDSYYHQTTKWGRTNTKYNYYVRYDDGIPTTKGCKADCYWIENKKGTCGDSDKIKYYNHPDVFDHYYNEKGEDVSHDSFNGSCNDSSKHVCGWYKDSYYDKDGNKVSKADYIESCTSKPKTRACVQTKDSQIEKDLESNQEKYENLKKACQAAASCNTTTAEFTISAKYTVKGETTEQTVEFPYSESKKDTIEYDKNTKTTKCTKEDISSTILSSAGCYNCGEATSQRMYMTEWSFPGTWIHNKTGKITYNPSAGVDETWRKVKDKFCLPLNIANVNEKWYNYYQAKVNGNDTSYSYNDTDYINNITCPDGKKLSNPCDYKTTTYTAEEAKSKEEGGITNYNINAHAENFGMFEWDIDISCFYAVNDLFPKLKETDECKTTCIDDGTKMRVRSVDLSNLFPDDEGTKLTDPSKTGRTPGFNWTSYADQTKKNEEYKSTPSDYAEWVQYKGSKVYSDEYLDYEINLTKEAINEIKKQFNTTMGKKYTNWEGEAEVNSVINYQSPLLRNGGILSKNSKMPIGNAIKCNNMKNYSSTECEDFSKEGK